MDESKTLALVLTENWHFWRGDMKGVGGGGGGSSANNLTSSRNQPKNSCPNMRTFTMTIKEIVF